MGVMASPVLCRAKPERIGRQSGRAADARSRLGDGSELCEEYCKAAEQYAWWVVYVNRLN